MEVKEVVDMTGGRLRLTPMLEQLMDGRSVAVTATGRSMLPTFRPGKDTIVLSPFRDEDLVPGAVVFFNRKDSVCVHRIIARRDDKLIIRGDGNAHNAFEHARVKDVFAIVSGGTMNGGHPFTTADERWARNTAFVMKHHKMLSRVHWVERILRSYSFSVLALIVLFGLSFFNTHIVEIPQVAFIDKWTHILMYFALCSVFWMEWLLVHAPGAGAAKGRMGRHVGLKGYVYCLLFPILLGGIIEIGQSATLYRSGEWLDFAANCVGCVLASAVAVFVINPLVCKFRK